MDGTTGQNALQQAIDFGEVTDLTGIVLTKMDGTAKGGIAVAIQSELQIPVKYIGVGETIEDLQKFNSDQFVNALFDIRNSLSIIRFIFFNSSIRFFLLCSLPAVSHKSTSTFRAFAAFTASYRKGWNCRGNPVGASDSGKIYRSRGNDVVLGITITAFTP